VLLVHSPGFWVDGLDEERHGVVLSVDRPHSNFASLVGWSFDHAHSLFLVVAVRSVLEQQGRIGLRLGRFLSDE
jgi:hypothetical protein